MADPQQQDVIVVDGAGVEHHFPAGMDPKKAAAIVKQQYYHDQTEKSLADFQQKAPAAMELLAGQTIPGVAQGAQALSNVYRASPAVQTTVKAAAGYPIYKVATALGVPPDYAGLIAGLPTGAGALKMLFQGKGNAPDNTGGTLNTDVPERPGPQNNWARTPIQAASLEDEVVSALQQARQPAPTSVGTLPPQPTLPPGYTPRSSVPQMTDIAPVKLTGKIVATAPNAVSPASVLKPTILDPEVADTPRDWTSSAVDPMLKNRMQAAHKDILFDDARYRMGTADTAAQLRANPQSVKDALLALLNAPKSP